MNQKTRLRRVNDGDTMGYARTLVGQCVNNGSRTMGVQGQVACGMSQSNQTAWVNPSCAFEGALGTSAQNIGTSPPKAPQDANGEAGTTYAG